MFELVSSLGSSFPWIYRAWLYLFSSQYRQTMKLRWHSMSRVYVLFDKLLSVIFMLAEIALITYLLTKQY